MRINFWMPVLILLAFLFVAPQFAASYAAGSLQFSPSTKSVSTGDSFAVQVTVNTGTDEVNGADAYIIYDPNILEMVSMTDGSFFPTTSHTVRSSNQLYFGGLRDTGAVVKGSGTLGTINFKAKANGTTSLTFKCGQGGTDDSGIYKNPDASNIIACSSNGTSAITVGSGGSSPTATPTPVGSAAATATPTPRSTSATATPTPRSSAAATATPAQSSTAGTNASSATPTPVKALPNTGYAENLLGFGLVGGLLFLLGIGARLLL